MQTLSTVYTLQWSRTGPDSCKWHPSGFILPLLMPLPHTPSCEAGLSTCLCLSEPRGVKETLVAPACIWLSSTTLSAGASWRTVSPISVWREQSPETAEARWAPSAFLPPHGCQEGHGAVQWKVTVPYMPQAVVIEFRSLSYVIILIILMLQRPGI